MALEDGAVSGPLPDLVAAFADSRDATVGPWTVGSEEDLVDDLEAGTLDLAIGGISEETPWVDRVSVTRGFDDLPGVDVGGVVFLLPMGENGLQAALETFLDEQEPGWIGGRAMKSMGRTDLPRRARQEALQKGDPVGVVHDRLHVDHDRAHRVRRRRVAGDEDGLDRGHALPHPAGRFLVSLLFIRHPPSRSFP